MFRVQSSFQIVTMELYIFFNLKKMKVVGVIGLGAYIYVYIGPGAQSDDIK